VLDEPVASLDPLARRSFLRHLMESVAENGSSVILSSHLVSDLERVCDYLIVLVSSRVRLTGETDDLLARHRRIMCSRRDAAELPPGLEEIRAEHTGRQSTFVVREAEGTGGMPAGDWSVEGVGLEDLVLTYMENATDPAPRPALLATGDAR
jgi:ABC-2 type transport system ATP-binding protein